MFLEPFHRTYDFVPSSKFKSVLFNTRDIEQITLAYNHEKPGKNIVFEEYRHVQTKSHHESQADSGKSIHALFSSSKSFYDTQICDKNGNCFKKSKL
jgi:hypothetical protein